LIKEELTLDKLKSASLLIISGSRQFYKQKDIDVILKYFENGGSLYIALGEGGVEKNNTNLNDFLESYGVTFNSDCVIRNSYSKYFHPKECYIEEGQYHSEISKTLKQTDKKKKVLTNEDLLDADVTDQDDDKIKIIYPFGCTLNLKNNKVSTLFNSGIISYPHKRPLMTAVLSKSKKGRMIIVGSENFVDDDYFEKEDNKKITVSFF